MPSAINGKVYYRTNEVCRIVGISRNTFFRWLREGSFADVEIVDRRGWRLFTEEDLERLKAEAYQTRPNNKKSGDMIGQSGLQFGEEMDEVELVTYIAKSWWEKGLGFESSSASLMFGFQELKLPQITAVTRIHNKAGQKLAEKLGFKYIGEGQAYGISAFFYRLLFEEFVPKLDAFKIIR